MQEGVDQLGDRAAHESESCGRRDHGRARDGVDRRDRDYAYGSRAVPLPSLPASARAFGDPREYQPDCVVSRQRCGRVVLATIKAEIGTNSWPDRASARRDIERRHRFHASPVLGTDRDECAVAGADDQRAVRGQRGVRVDRGAEIDVEQHDPGR